ncbi:MAG: 6-bladed beta-propeller [Flavobacteriaceae bacterium]|nr:6-bladed beta-propeller [Flavobacteriaceae bacterium]
MKLLIGVFFLFLFVRGEAQKIINIDKEQSFKTFKVQWVSQFPLFKGQKEVSKKGWFAKFIFGKKNTFKIIKPIDIIAINPDSFYILDQGVGTIFTINESKKKIPKVLKKNKVSFNSLVNFCSFTNDEILFTDSRLNKIFKLNESQKKLEVLNENIKLQQPTGIAYSIISKEVWVVDTGAHRISVLNEQGELIKTIGKRGVASGEFNFPTSIWIDKIGNVYVIDAMNFRIQVFNKTGEVISIFGEAGNATGYFARPKGIATDSFGNIYITDALYHTVQVFDISGNFLYQFGEQGRGKEQFWMPSGIYIDEKNYIYIADSYNSRIQIFQLINEK